jgi:hypothetical protein
VVYPDQVEGDQFSALFANGKLLHDAMPAARYEAMTGDERQGWQAGILERQRGMERDLLADVRRRLKAEKEARPARPRASAREHAGRRVASGGRSPDDPDPDLAARRERTRVKVAAHRESRKEPCSRCERRVLKLHAGLCWDCTQAETRKDAEATADREIAANFAARLERVGETGAARSRVETAARLRHVVRCALVSANGNHADLVAFEHRLTVALRDRWQDVRLAEARDRRGVRS